MAEEPPGVRGSRERRGCSPIRGHSCGSLVAFAAFCAVASGTYFVNDAVDAEADRAHPTKRHRPVAAGEVSRRLAVAVGRLLAAAGIGAGRRWTGDWAWCW